MLHTHRTMAYFQVTVKYTLQDSTFKSLGRVLLKTLYCTSFTSYFKNAILVFYIESFDI
jgi:hypothetical protein